MPSAHDHALKLIDQIGALSDSVRGFGGDVSALRVPLLQEKFSGRQRGVLEKHFTETARGHLKDMRTDSVVRGQALEALVEHSFFDPVAKDVQWAKISDYLKTTNTGKGRTSPENASVRATAQRMMLQAAYRLQYHLDEIVNNHALLLPHMGAGHPVARVMRDYRDKYLPELREALVHLKQESHLSEAEVAEIFLEAANNDGAERLTLIDPAEWPKKRGPAGPDFS